MQGPSQQRASGMAAGCAQQPATQQLPALAAGFCTVYRQCGGGSRTADGGARRPRSRSFQRRGRASVRTAQLPHEPPAITSMNASQRGRQSAHSSERVALGRRPSLIAMCFDLHCNTAKLSLPAPTTDADDRCCSQRAAGDQGRGGRSGHT
jgi:hypothetical protein